MEEEKWNPAEDTLSAEEKIDKFTGEVDCSYIKPHYTAGNLLYVDPSADLKQIAMAFAEDDKTFVEKSMQNGDLVQPCDLHFDHWESVNARFRVTIVRPFILAQGIL
ncbi:MAG: DUF2288 family protein [Opitutales bacterium]